MPRITLYIKDADLPTWLRARDLAVARDESLSALVITALELVVGRRELPTAAGAEAMSTIELVGWDWRRRTVPRTLRFTGVRAAQEGALTAYLTRSGKIVLEEWALLDERYLAVFDSFEALQADPLADALDSGVLVDLAAAAGTQYVETLE
ncbi:hypothetical protein [Luteitalea sp.]|uniref:hypothetical protein n=1 Tax=Luteitalea sp. TaxID=2004800 RepID=UPI0025C447C9|nr:hypothetical protein [Luteitalea sp.]